MRRLATAALLVLVVPLVCAPLAHAAPAGRWDWPVVGPIVRGFQAPTDPYGPGHRGIDIGTPFGSEVVAPASGTVVFAGTVAGALYVTIDHGGGIASSYSWLSVILVHRGERVAAGEPIARSGAGDPRAGVANLMMSVRVDGTYVDPLLFLLPLDVGAWLRLAPVDGPAGGSSPRMSRPWSPPFAPPPSASCAWCRLAPSSRWA